MSEVDIKDLSDDLLIQRLETVEYEFDKITEAYAKEVEDVSIKKNYQEVNNKCKKAINKIAKKYTEYLIPITIEIEELEEELERRGILSDKE